MEAAPKITKKVRQVWLLDAHTTLAAVPGAKLLSQQAVYQFADQIPEPDPCDAQTCANTAIQQLLDRFEKLETYVKEILER